MILKTIIVLLILLIWEEGDDVSYRPITTKLDNYGDLYIYEIIDRLGYPSIFTCVNYHQEKFLFYYADSEKDWDKWVVVKLSKKDNEKLFSSKKTIRSIIYDNYDKTGNVLLYDYKKKKAKIVRGENIDDYICDPEDDFYVSKDKLEIVNKDVIKTIYDFNKEKMIKKNNRTKVSIYGGYAYNNLFNFNESTMALCFLDKNNKRIGVRLSTSQKKKLLSNPCVKFFVVPDVNTFTSSIVIGERKVAPIKVDAPRKRTTKVKKKKIDGSYSECKILINKS